MQYKDLKEMNISEWDGKPFRAIVNDCDENSLFYSDKERLDNKREADLIVGYKNGVWCTNDDGYTWEHAYPVEWNRKKVEESSKPKRMTYRQLSKWLAKGNGVLWKSECNYIEFTSHNYVTKYADTEVMDDWKVRKWDSEEWIEPTVDLLEDF